MPKSDAFNMHAMIEQRHLALRVFRAATSAFLLLTALRAYLLLLNCLLSFTTPTNEILVDASAFGLYLCHRFRLTLICICFKLFFHARCARTTAIT